MTFGITDVPADYKEFHTVTSKSIIDILVCVFM